MKTWMVAGIAFALVLALFGGTTALAQDEAVDDTEAFEDDNLDGVDDRLAFGHRFGMRRGGGFRWIGLGLTEEQQATLKETVAALREMGVQRLGVSHCTGFAPSAYLAHEFGDGFFLNNAGTRFTLPF